MGAPPTVYRSDDVGAPTLSGSGSDRLVALLDACLVNGYGSKPAAGWTKPFTGTNKAAFRQGGGLQRYLRVDDAVTAQFARLVTYDTMTDVDTGTGPMPTEAQRAGGFYLRRSTTNDTVPRAWIVVANAESVHVIVFGASSSPNTGLGTATFSFGDLVSPVLANDTGRSFVIGATSTSTTGTTFDYARMPLFIQETSVDYSTSYLRSDETLESGPVSAARWSLFADTVGTNSGQTFVSQQWSEQIAAPETEGVRLSPLVMTRFSNQSARGIVPGLLYVAGAARLFGFRQGDRFRGKRGGPYADREFMMLFNLSSAVVTGAIAIEMTGGTW